VLAEHDPIKGYWAELACCPLLSGLAPLVKQSWIAGGGIRPLARNERFSKLLDKRGGTAEVSFVPGGMKVFV
jgi:hypothetical protein